MDDEIKGIILFAVTLFLVSALVYVISIIIATRPSPPVVKNVVYFPNGSTTIVLLNPNNESITIQRIELGGGVIECTLASPITLPPGNSSLVGYISETGMGSLNNTLVSCINTKAAQIAEEQETPVFVPIYVPTEES
jgi:hypothetical protein